ncbi:MAG: SRPBCC domain-containing protein [Bacteroidota bacterium]
MALNLRTEILLSATPDAVWAVLTDFASYPDWNLFLTHASGDWSVGNTVAITAGGMSFKPVVLAYETGKELRWRGNLLLDTLFVGEHYFLLEERTPGKTLLTHGEDFRGVLLPILRSKLVKDTKAGFEAMNEALAARLTA